MHYTMIRMKEMQNFAKKTISALLSLVTVASYPLSCGAKGTAFGDVNGDSAINSADALLVLSYSVDSVKLTDEQLYRADVNADGRVNSSDALEILRHSVGLIERFKAEESDKIDAEEAVGAYNKAVERAKDFKPSYKLVETVASNVDNVKVSSKSILISPSMLKDAENQIKEDNNYNKKYVRIVKQKSNDSASRMLSTIDPTAVSTFDSVSCEINEKGNYILTIKFKDEKNPTESSPIVKVLGQDTYEEAKKKIAGENEIGGASSTVEAFNFTYKNGVLKCEIDPITSEFVDINWSLTCVSESKVSTIGILAEMKVTGTNGASYSDFGY